MVLAPMLVSACASGADPRIAADAEQWRPVEHGAERKRVTINGVDLAYLEAGSGPTLLFIHGAMASKDCRHRQIAWFARDYHVVAPDLRGHGESEAGPGPHTAELHAADMVALMDRVGAARFFVCGHFARFYMRSASASALVRTFANQAGEHDSQTRANLYAAMSRYADDKELIMQIWHAVEAFRSKHRLGEIAQPTLIVSPVDNRQAWAQAKHMERAIPHARRVIVPDAGHMVMLDNPSGFNAALAEFLSVASISSSARSSLSGSVTRLMVAYSRGCRLNFLSSRRMSTCRFSRSVPCCRPCPKPCAMPCCIIFSAPVMSTSSIR